MRRRTVGPLTAALVALGVTGAVSPVPALKLPGFTRQPITVEQGTQVLGMVLHARNVVAGLPEHTLDPLPCTPGSLLLGTVSRAPFARLKGSLISQGWQIVKAVPGQGGREVAFQAHKGAVTALGLWTTGAHTQPAVLMVCEQAAVWKPEPAVRAPQKSAPLGASVKFTVKDWRGGAQPLQAVLITGVRGGTPGTISAAGQVNLPLVALPPAQLLPVTKWRQAFDLLDCTDGRPVKGSVNISAPAVKFMAVRKLMTQNGRAVLTVGVMNAAMTSTLSTPLIYTSAPVRLSGQLTCGDGDRKLTVDLTLPGGWTTVTHQTDLPDFGMVTQRTMNFAGQWGWSEQH